MKNLKLVYRLLIIVGVAVIGMVTITALDLMNLRENLMEDRKEKTRDLVDTAYTLIKHYADMEAAGLLNRIEAQTAAMAAVRALRYEGDNYFWINDFQKRMIMHPVKPALEGKDFSEVADANGKRFFDDFIEAAKGGGGFVDYVWPKPGGEVPEPKIAYVRPYEPWGWIVGTGIYVDDVDDVFFAQALESGGFLVLALLAGGIVSLVIASGITRPLGQMTTVMSALTEGRLDVQVPGSDRRDEVGLMARSIQVFKQNALEMKRLEHEHERERARGEEEKRRAMLTLADQFESTVGGIARAVANASTELNASAQSMSAAVEETKAQADAVVDAADHASLNVETVASAAEELSGSIQEIGRQVADSSVMTAEAVAEAKQSSAQMQGLADAAQKIGEVVDLINEIAGQTNLLALNATIEAARAGEAGKGFAVVASEVKTLAGQTAKATEQITSQITAVQSETRGAVDAIAGIGRTIARISEISAAIAAAVEEQGAATGEIARNAEQAATGTREVNGNIKGVNEAAGESGRVAAEVRDAAIDLSRQAEALSNEVACVLAGMRGDEGAERPGAERVAGELRIAA